jgi:hypothetical protein
MASIDWSAYVVLCDQMWDQHDAWYDAANLVELTERVTRSCSETAGAYMALSRALADGRTEDEVALMLRFAALSRPAADYDMGADYAGWFVSEYPTGTQRCALRSDLPSCPCGCRSTSRSRPTRPNPR